MFFIRYDLSGPDMTTLIAVVSFSSLLESCIEGEECDELGMNCGEKLGMCVEERVEGFHVARF